VTRRDGLLRTVAGVVVTIAVGAGLVAYGVRSWTAARRSRAETQIAAVRTCLVGGEQPPPGDAQVAARRWLASQGRSPEDCLPRAAVVLEVKVLEAFGDGARQRALDLHNTLIDDRLDAAVEPFFEVFAAVPWVAPAGGPPGTALAAPVVDRDLAQLRDAWPAYAPSRFAGPGTVLYALGQGRALEVASGGSGALSELRLGVWPDPAAQLTAWADAGKGSARLVGRDKIFDLGPATQATVVGPWVLLVHGASIVARRHLGGLRFGPPRAVPLPAEPGDGLVFRGCPHPRGYVVAATDVAAGDVGVLFATDDGIASWPWTNGKPAVDGALFGAAWPTCHAAGVRVAWAVSEPNVRSAPLGGPSDPVPQGPHPVRVETLRCDIPAGCAGAACVAPRPCPHAVARIPFEDLGWRGMGGSGSSFSMNTPTAVDLGAAVALVWSGTGALKLKLAPLGDLAATAPQAIVEVLHPDRPMPRDPRAVNYPDTDVVSWGDALLLEVKEREPDPKTFVVRIDAAGDVRALRPDAAR
jgi:hypothetical protein